ncbi:hypothetical protein Bind_3290 [Beijerinckia indica subsp. indica ATCC 9039]|uniref:Uncharacterized protein n=1 Tax=Beijerinckia indica subsp. indica (strain ATCC 9039 / DSM 1715 / NCIMB 8712) TaxID=395963 RepID=B2IDR7_BEII9|nr:hypothetical protein Bind_3290 [Beijerinckia indica subsp. indica ATCC 9039]
MPSSQWVMFGSINIHADLTSLPNCQLIGFQGLIGNDSVRCGLTRESALQEDF